MLSLNAQEARARLAHALANDHVSGTGLHVGGLTSLMLVSEP